VLAGLGVRMPVRVMGVRAEASVSAMFRVTVDCAFATVKVAVSLAEPA